MRIISGKFLLYSLILFALILPLDVNAQNIKEANPNVGVMKQQSDLEYLSRTQARIKRIRPSVSDEVLNEDARLIDSALPEIKIELSKVGLDEQAAYTASGRAWATARLVSALKYEPEKNIDQTALLDHIKTEVAPLLVAEDIKKAKPEISVQTLATDRKLIEAALAEITIQFEKSGRSTDEARVASLVAWKKVRLESPLSANREMNRDSFIELTSDHLGAIVFRSDPDQAEVFIGAERIGVTQTGKPIPFRFFEDNETVTARFVRAGITEQRTCTAIARNRVECRADFRKTP